MNHDMNRDAAERYFDSSIFVQLYTLMADALSHRSLRSGSNPSSGNPAPASTPGLLARLDGWFSRQEQKARDDYLARSADVFEVERRIEALERGLVPRCY